MKLSILAQYGALKCVSGEADTGHTLGLKAAVYFIASTRVGNNRPDLSYCNVD